MYQLQYKAWDYVGWTDTKFVQAKDFGSLVDLPRFYETMGLGSSEAEQNAKHRHSSSAASNTDAITDGQLLVEFFEFYGYTFDNDKQAIDIRHCD